jgi:integrase
VKGRNRNGREVSVGYEVDPERMAIVRRVFEAIADGGSLKGVRSDKFEALYTLCLMAGLRQGEELGLQWSDKDLDAGTLRVNRQLQRVRRNGEKSGRLVFTEPKNASRRAVGCLRGL